MEAAAIPGTVGYATTKDATTNECYNENFLQKNQWYNERGEILSAQVARACQWRVGASRFN